MADAAGNFTRVGAPVARQSGDYTVVDVSLTAGHGEAIGTAVINADGKVAGHEAWPGHGLPEGDPALADFVSGPSL